MSADLCEAHRPTRSTAIDRRSPHRPFPRRPSLQRPPYRNADIGQRQGGRIVHPITDHHYPRRRPVSSRASRTTSIFSSGEHSAKTRSTPTRPSDSLADGPLITGHERNAFDPDGPVGPAVSSPASSRIRSAIRTAPAKLPIDTDQDPRQPGLTRFLEQLPPRSPDARVAALAAAIRCFLPRRDVRQPGPRSPGRAPRSRPQGRRARFRAPRAP